MATSAKAVAKYQKRVYDQVLLRVKKGIREEWQEHAKLTGESMSALIQRAVAETMARDRVRIAELMRKERASE